MGWGEFHPENTLTNCGTRPDKDPTMMYQCIKCRKTWGDGHPEKDGYSHGLCIPCLKDALTPLYRKRQAQEGNFDCFGKSSGFCDQLTCKYRKICLGV